VRCNQIDDVLNISTPTACQVAETVAAASTSTARLTYTGGGVVIFLYTYI